MLFRMQRDVKMGPWLEAAGLGKQVHPADAFGCAHGTMWTPSALVKDSIARLFGVHSADVFASGDGYRGTKLPPLFGIQIRRGGSGVKWRDPKRISKGDMRRVPDCVKAEVLRFLGQHPNGKVFLTSDSALAYNQVAQHVPSQNLVEYKRHIFYHTGRSKSAEKSLETEQKVMIDFVLLSLAQDFLVTRSSFGEAAAWIAFQRPAFVEKVCKINDILDCATVDC
jgi:hypothetical protein